MNSHFESNPFRTSSCDLATMPQTPGEPWPNLSFKLSLRPSTDSPATLAPLPLYSHQGWGPANKNSFCQNVGCIIFCPGGEREWELPIKDAHFFEKYHQKKGNTAGPRRLGKGCPRKLMPAKRLPHLLGFLAFKNHSSSRHHQNPIHSRPISTRIQTVAQIVSKSVWLGPKGAWSWVYYGFHLP